MAHKEEAIPQLELPKRWELLAKRAEEMGIDVTQFVERVELAEERISKLLTPMTKGQGGLIEVIYGLSGSGKTTFLKTLPKFFPKVQVEPFLKDRDLAELPKFIEKKHVPGSDFARIILIEGRDNPKENELRQVKEVFSDLINTFRLDSGQVLVLWPVTTHDAAQLIAKTAWDTGADSMADPTTEGLYIFKGMPKERYFDVADLTTRNLTGDGLEAFGIDNTVANKLLSECKTIAQFFSEVNKVASETHDHTYSILRARVRPRLWVLLPGDDVTALDASVSSLTQGAKSMIDIDKMRQLIADPNNEALYVEKWRSRKGKLAHLLRAIDVRLFSVPPNVALAAVRAVGHESLKKELKQSAFNLEQAKDVLRASRFYKTILGRVLINAHR